MSENDTDASSNNPPGDKGPKAKGYRSHAAYRKQRKILSTNHTGTLANRQRGRRARTERNIARLAKKDVPTITTSAIDAFTASLGNRASDVDYFPPLDERDFRHSVPYQGALPHSLTVAELDSGEEIQAFLKVRAFTSDGTIGAIFLRRVDERGDHHSYCLPEKNVQTTLRLTSHFQYCRNIEEVDKVTRYCFIKQGYYTSTTSLFTAKGQKAFLNICEVFKKATLATENESLDEVAQDPESDVDKTGTPSLSPTAHFPGSVVADKGSTALPLTLGTQEVSNKARLTDNASPQDADAQGDKTQATGEPDISLEVELNTEPLVASPATVNQIDGQGEQRVPLPVIYQIPLAQMAAFSPQAQIDIRNIDTETEAARQRILDHDVKIDASQQRLLEEAAVIRTAQQGKAEERALIAALDIRREQMFRRNLDYLTADVSVAKAQSNEFAADYAYKRPRAE